MNDKNLVSIWGNAVSIGENRPESYGKDITLRYPIYVQVAGDAVEIAFDNYCGTEAITIHHTTLRVGTVFHTLHFNGNEAVTIPARERVYSDLLEVEVGLGETVDVSFYLGTLHRCAPASTTVESYQTTPFGLPEIRREILRFPSMILSPLITSGSLVTLRFVPRHQLIRWSATATPLPPRIGPMIWHFYARSMG